MDVVSYSRLMGDDEELTPAQFKAFSNKAFRETLLGSIADASSRPAGMAC
jgi:hypothetical protein